MKWHRFEDKMPIVGANILVINTSDKAVGIINFDCHAHNLVTDKIDHGEYYPVDFYTDNPLEDIQFDIKCCDYWAYPSSVKIPK